MAWTLYGAEREKARNVLAEAVCLGITHDASTRGSLLLTQYVANGPSLERASGTLLFADDKTIAGSVDRC